MASPPSNIKVHRERRLLELTWPEGGTSLLPFRFVRGRCPCAACVDENTGERMVDVMDVSEDIAPTQLGFSGNYALRVEWSDDHDTGLYTWDWLEQISREFATASRS
jgi:DUF971 family protein